MKKNKTAKILISIILAAAFLSGARISVFASDDLTGVGVVSSEYVREVAEGIIEWKKSDVGALPDGYLINDKFLEQAGTTPGDWFPIGLGRLGVADNQSGYLAVIDDNVQKRYDDKSGNKLDAAKATEWHRISLAVLACGGNPRAMGEDRDGDGRGDIDLIADGTYARVDKNGNGIVGKQGINGFIWALIALDSMSYETPPNAFYSRDDLIINLLNKQLSDGGWALTGAVSDPDITAMAVQALAPYYNSEKEYSYVDASGKPTVAKARDAADKAVEWLSKEQLDDGDFFSWGMPNCESTAQVAVALCSLGVDIFSDERFITESGKTLLDGMLKYRTASGGFTHSFISDAENPSAVAGQPNTMASEQALYAMAAIIRAMEGDRRLYDFRAEQSDELKAQIAAAEAEIAALTDDSSEDEIRAVYGDYLAINALERSYVRNYKKLSELLEAFGIEYEKEEPIYNSGDAGVSVPTEYFDYGDQASVNALPSKLTLAHRTEVLRLWKKINNSVDFEGKREMTIRLEKAKNEIDAIQAEIDDIKKEIKEQLYPFEFIGLNKREIVYALYERYMALSEYDRAQFEVSDIEGLLKCKTQADNLLTALIISICCAAAAVGISVWVVLHIRKRKRLKRENEMQESDE